MPASPGQPAGKLDPLIERLWRAFREQLVAAGGFSITPPCEEYVRRFITDGARKLIKSHAEHHQVVEAEENIRNLARQMVEEARSENTRILSESVFFTVKSRLCPLWPFC
jgi:hypothetical protein